MNEYVLSLRGESGIVHRFLKRDNELLIRYNDLDDDIALKLIIKFEDCLKDLYKYKIRIEVTNISVKALEMLKEYQKLKKLNIYLWNRKLEDW